MLAFLLFTLPAAACVPGEGHRKRVADFERDSIVIDSIAQLVPIDSLYRLHRQLLTTTNAAVQFQLIECERTRLKYRYGLWPRILAEHRMEDTLWAGVPLDTLAAMRSRWPSFLVTAVGARSCGVPRGAREPAFPQVDIFKRPRWWHPY